MSRPTDLAIDSFKDAFKHAGKSEHYRSVVDKDQIGKPADNKTYADIYLARSISDLASGLTNLSHGLRAIYILLEKSKNSS
jgi:hypothetical protein